MALNEIRRAGEGIPGSGGPEYENGSSSNANVVAFPRNLNTGFSFDQLTTQLILDQHRRGVLQENLLIALLAGVGLRP
jgi:hypothetical protein